LFKLAYK